MTIKELYEQTAIKELEYQILNIETFDRRRWEWGKTYPNKVKIIRPLIETRKKLLNENFIADDENHHLISELNEVIKTKQKEICNQKEKLLETAVKSGLCGIVQTFDSWFFGKHYPKAHPIQTMRAKKMWAVLSNPNNFEGNFHDGIDVGWSSIITYFPDSSPTESDGGVMRWRDVDHCSKICGVEVCPILYDLYKLSYYSIYDMLWVRSFDVQIHVRTIFQNYEDEFDEDDIPPWIDI